MKYLRHGFEKEADENTTVLNFQLCIAGLW